MRAALLPTPGDPFLVSYWLRNLETWRGEVDEVLVCVNGQPDPAVVAYLKGLFADAGVLAAFSEGSLGHDGAMRWLLEHTSADTIVLCEDDAYVRHPGAVTAAFERIESGATDLVASPRHEDYVTSERQDWGSYRPGGLAELRHGLWPAFLFARPADLLATDRLYGDRAWSVGEDIEGWGTVTHAACAYVGIAADYLHLDTFFGTTFQLRAKGLRTELVHDVRLYDPAAVETWLAEDPPWFHVTNLSTFERVVAGIPISAIPDAQPNGGLWTRRMAWWRRTWTTGDPSAPGYVAYGRLLDDFIERSHMDRAELAAWDARFDPWVTWPEMARVPA